MKEMIHRPFSARPIAAIDLGSNALRAVIARPVGKRLEILKEIRDPLRLGEDVFNEGHISGARRELTEESFIRLLHLFAAYGVEDVCCLATSAMRDAKNGQELIGDIRHATGIEVETISGQQEARLIFRAVANEISLEKKRGLFMDIGGGSTELSIVMNGELVASHSFNIGTVRLLKLQDQQFLAATIAETVEGMRRFARSYLGARPPDVFVGTGGNLRRMGKIRRKILRKPSTECTYPEVAHMADTLFSMSFVERIRRLELDQNRADVILPATMLTREVMKSFDLKKVLLPRVGLKEGILLSMLDPDARWKIVRPKLSP